MLYGTTLSGHSISGWWTNGGDDRNDDDDADDGNIKRWLEDRSLNK